MNNDVVYNRLINLPLDAKHSMFLFGPRGTGKTFWLKHHLPDALYFNLLNTDTYGELASKPTRLEEIVTKTYTGWVIIDEIQKLPILLNEVQRMIDSYKTRFILTGSSARSLRKKGVNLLGGRARVYHMHPLISQELGDDFNLSKALKNGLLPMALLDPDPQGYLKNYLRIYINEEVQQERLTRNLSGFNRFLETASFSQGSVLNYSEIGRELYLNRLQVADYFNILEDLLLATRIDVFTKRAKRKTIMHQKFYFFDAGVYKVARPTSVADTRAEEEGVGLETLFLQSLQALNDYLNLDYKIQFWRTKTGLEVDFVILGPRGFHAFEIKRSNNTGGGALRGLKAFGEEYPEAKLHYIFCGNFKQYHDNITAIPFEEALRELPKLIS